MMGPHEQQQVKIALATVPTDELEAEIARRARAVADARRAAELKNSVEPLEWDAEVSVRRSKDGFVALVTGHGSNAQVFAVEAERTGTDAYRNDQILSLVELWLESLYTE